MPTDTNPDIIAIRQWIEKEPHLPKDFDDFALKKFLHSCYGSLERTKECIERFCTSRSLMPEMYTFRDPRSTAVETAFSITNMTSIEIEGYSVLFHQIDDPGLDKFVFYDIVKAFGIIGDYHLQYMDSFPDAHMIVMDMKDYTLKIIPKVNVMFLRHFLLYLLETMPLRVKRIYIVNSPSYYEAIYALVKPVLPNQLRELISFHPDAECLKSVINKQQLPKDYGGDGPSLHECQLQRLKDIESLREWYLNDNLWKADLTKKKNSSVSNNLNGSFRTLSFD